MEVDRSHPSLSDTECTLIPVTTLGATAGAAAGGQPLVEGPKYQLALKLSEIVNVTNVGEKIMDSSITLNMRELFTVSTDISNYVN